MMQSTMDLSWISVCFATADLYPFLRVSSHDLELVELWTDHPIHSRLGEFQQENQVVNRNRFQQLALVSLDC